MKPGLYVPIEVAQQLKALLKAAKCPNTDCIDGVCQRGFDEVFQCQWCAERDALLAEPK